MGVDEGLLLEIRVGFEFVGDGADPAGEAVVEDLGELVRGEVGDADVPG